MKPYGIRYLVSHHEAFYDLPADYAGTLDVVNELTGNVFWFDNENGEWHKSIYSASTTLEGINTQEYIEVEYFDNGYINTDDLWVEGARASLISRYEDEFQNNILLTEEQSEI